MIFKRQQLNRNRSKVKLNYPDSLLSCSGRITTQPEPTPGFYINPNNRPTTLHRSHPQRLRPVQNHLTKNLGAHLQIITSLRRTFQSAVHSRVQALKLATDHASLHRPLSTVLQPPHCCDFAETSLRNTQALKGRAILLFAFITAPRSPRTPDLSLLAPSPTSPPSNQLSS